MAIPRQSISTTRHGDASDGHPVLRWDTHRRGAELQQEHAPVALERAATRSWRSDSPRSSLVHGGARPAAHRRHKPEPLRLSTGNAGVPGLEQHRKGDVHTAAESDVGRKIHRQLRNDSILAEQLVLLTRSGFDSAAIEPHIRPNIRCHSLAEMAGKRSTRTHSRCAVSVPDQRHRHAGHR